MSIDKAKEILSKRTKGRWFVRYEDYTDGGLELRDRIIVGSSIGSNYPLTTPEGIEADASAESICIINNIADELIAVYEAAKNITHELDDYFSTTGDLKEAIQALEAKLEELP